MTIIAVAIRYDEGTVSLRAPSRHNELVALHVGVTKSSDTRGFLTDLGEFLDRRQAADYAFRTGQITSLRSPPNLTSEDLW